MESRSRALVEDEGDEGPLSKNFNVPEPENCRDVMEIGCIGIGQYYRHWADIGNNNYPTNSIKALKAFSFLLVFFYFSPKKQQYYMKATKCNRSIKHYLHFPQLLAATLRLDLHKTSAVFSHTVMLVAEDIAHWCKYFSIHNQQAAV